jgi:hypothetical protein
MIEYQFTKSRPIPTQKRKPKRELKKTCLDPFAAKNNPTKRFLGQTLPWPRTDLARP